MQEERPQTGISDTFNEHLINEHRQMQEIP